MAYACLSQSFDVATIQQMTDELRLRQGGKKERLINRDSSVNQLSFAGPAPIKSCASAMRLLPRLDGEKSLHKLQLHATNEPAVLKPT